MAEQTENTVAGRFGHAFLLELVERLLKAESMQQILQVTSSYLRFGINLKGLVLTLRQFDDIYRIHAPLLTLSSQGRQEARLRLNESEFEGFIGGRSSISTTYLADIQAMQPLLFYLKPQEQWQIFRIGSGHELFGFAFVAAAQPLRASEEQLLRGVCEHLAMAILRIEQLERLNELNQDVLAANTKLRSQQRGLHQTNKELKQTLDAISAAQDELLEVRKQASLGKLIRGIAHEMNTPAGVCVTAASGIVDHCQQLRGAQQGQELTQAKFNQHLNQLLHLGELVQSNSDRLANLIHTFKTAAADEWAEEPSTFDLKPLLEDALAQCQFRREQTFSCDIHCAADLSLHGYPRALVEALVLLLDNSAEFALRTEQDKVSLHAEHVDDSVTITLSDTGPGMSEEQRRNLFEPFHTTARKSGHVGLGAHIAHNLITQKYGGQVKVLSAAHEPTVIRISLPIK